MAASALGSPAELLAEPAVGGYQVTTRGKDFAVFARTARTTNQAGKVLATTNQFTLLEKNLHYLDQGAWLPSEDMLESCADGARSSRSPDVITFGSNLNSETAFDLQTATGQRLRGGVRAIRLTDRATGRSLTVASVKADAPGELHPPN
ncbi:MAG TPA: hypothetical protein VGK40_05100 [Verrucomicrobiae bacterium]